MGVPTDFRFITWNLNAMGSNHERARKQLDFLAAELGDGPAVVALQEVSQATYDVLTTTHLFGWHQYSLVHRPPGSFDRGNRRLGCVLAGTANTGLRSAAVLERLPFPERSLRAEIEIGGSLFVAISYHSLTGVGYKNAKGAAYRGLLEYLTPRSVPDLPPRVVPQVKLVWPQPSGLVLAPEVQAV